jgi:hypothetical protein
MGLAPPRCICHRRQAQHGGVRNGAATGVAASRAKGPRAAGHGGSPVPTPRAGAGRAPPGAGGRFALPRARLAPPRGIVAGPIAGRERTRDHAPIVGAHLASAANGGDDQTRLLLTGAAAPRAPAPGAPRS